MPKNKRRTGPQYAVVRLPETFDGTADELLSYAALEEDFNISYLTVVRYQHSEAPGAKRKQKGDTKRKADAKQRRKGGWPTANGRRVLPHYPRKIQTRSGKVPMKLLRRSHVEAAVKKVDDGKLNVGQALTLSGFSDERTLQRIVKVGLLTFAKRNSPVTGKKEKVCTEEDLMRAVADWKTRRVAEKLTLDDEVYLSVEKAAETIGCAEGTLRNWVNDKCVHMDEIHAESVGRRLFIRELDVNELREACTAAKNKQRRHHAKRCDATKIKRKLEKRRSEMEKFLPPTLDHVKNEHQPIPLAHLARLLGVSWDLLRRAAKQTEFLPEKKLPTSIVTIPGGRTQFCATLRNARRFLEARKAAYTDRQMPGGWEDAEELKDRLENILPPTALVLIRGELKTGRDAGEIEHYQPERPVYSRRNPKRLCRPIFHHPEQATAWLLKRCGLDEQSETDAEAASPTVGVATPVTEPEPSTQRSRSGRKKSNLRLFIEELDRQGTLDQMTTNQVRAAYHRKAGRRVGTEDWPRASLRMVQDTVKNYRRPRAV